MYSSPDHRVLCHQLASERREANRPIWDKTINIKAILERDPRNKSEEHAAAVANEIAALIRLRVPASWLSFDGDDFDSDLLEVVDGMAALRPDSYVDDPSFSALEDLNEMLSALYDWADIHRIWLGS